MSHLAFTVLCIHKQLRQLLKGIKKDKISQMPIQTPQRKTLCSITIGVAMITYTHYTAFILKCNRVSKLKVFFWTRMVCLSRTALFTLWASSWVQQNRKRTASSDTLFSFKGHFKFFGSHIFWDMYMDWKRIMFFRILTIYFWFSTPKHAST